MTAKESPFFRWKSPDRFLSLNTTAASIDDDFARFDVSCRKHSPSVKWAGRDDDSFHVPRQF